MLEIREGKQEKLKDQLSELLEGSGQNHLHGYREDRWEALALARLQERRERKMQNEQSCVTKSESNPSYFTNIMRNERNL